MKTYASPGQFAFKVPKGVSQIRVEAVGGGGGGGGGGGNNNGYLSGSGGGGGGSASGVSCLLAVKSGRTIGISVARGGVGGTAGKGQDNDGGKGRSGTATYMRGEGIFVYALNGEGGKGGDASGQWASGKSSPGGEGGGTESSKCLGGSDIKKTRGKDGRPSEEAGRYNPTTGGSGAEIPLYLKTCSRAGSGAYGGEGAGNSGGDSSAQEPSTPGKTGVNGCVVLTYTVNANTS
ncbi:hypothetical protein ACIOD1_33210 [Streptomyces sp. NPDC088097]|uniref:glycine-rich domain-containing protein n=1 Tax=Streptomyces sp. NPDC088097 TaxID=3365823 RepID=UPI0037FAEE8B